MQEPNIRNKLKGGIIIIRQGDTRYGLSGTRVLEIISTPHVTTAPRQPEYIKGICNYKGSIIPVLSLGKLSGEAGAEEESVCAIFRVDDHIFGLSVNQVEEMIYDNGEEIELDRNHISNSHIYIRKVIKAELPIFVLDIPEIIDHLKAREEESLK